MPQLLVRHVSQAAVDELKRRARSRGVSAQAELRAILEDNLKPADHSDWWAEAHRIRAELAGRNLEDSTDIIRRHRDSR